MSEIDPANERRIVELLERRATRVEPVADGELVALSAAASGAGSSVTKTSSRVLIAAAVVAIAVAGVQLGRPGDGGPTLETNPIDLTAMAAVASVEPGPSLIVWLRPGIAETDLAAVEAQLDEHPDVEDFAYVDEEATFAEFARYYADQPEVVALVDADMLPTSFRVITGSPESVAAGTAQLPGVLSADSG